VVPTLEEKYVEGNGDRKGKFLYYTKHQLCAGGAPGQTYGCIRSAVGWGCIPPPPVGMGRGESAAPEFTS